MPNTIQLRDYQRRLIERVAAHYEAGYVAPMMRLPTAGGKTICFAYMSDTARDNGNRVFIFVHRKQLVKQTSEALTANGIDHGVIAAGYPRTDHPIQVVSIQTFINRMHKIPVPDWLVFDEGHRVQAATYKKIIEWARAKGARFLVVTATPDRADGKGFLDICDVLIEGDDEEQLMKDGWLTIPTYFTPPINGIEVDELDLNSNGDYIEEQMEDMIDKPVITGSAVGHYKKYLPHHPPTVVFCVSVKHAQNMALQFTAAGIPSASIDGTMDDDDREDLINKLATGEIKCLMSCDLISEGFDLPAIEAVIMLRPIGDRCTTLFIQQVGRALRLAKGKTRAYVLDHVGNLRRHGYAHCDENLQKRDWQETFRGRKPKKKKNGGCALKTCPKCYCSFPPQPTCPSCGAPLVGEAANNAREIKEVDGELIQVDPTNPLSLVAAPVKKTEKPKKQPVVTRLERA